MRIMLRLIWRIVQIVGWVSEDVSVAGGEVSVSVVGETIARPKVQIMTASPVM